MSILSSASRIFVASTATMVFSSMALGVETSGSPLPIVSSTIHEAFHAESVGDFKSRKIHLALLSKNSSNAAAQSLLGHVRNRKDEWHSIEECIETYVSNSKLLEYESKRASIADTADGQLEMAKWCELAKLPEQRRAHLVSALRIDPENTVAHEALGHRRVGWNWITPEQMRRAEERWKLNRSSIQQFGATMRTIASDLGSGKTKSVAIAEKRLFGISDRKAIPAMEAAFSNVSDRAMESGLNWLSNHPDPEASLSLTRFAVYHPSSFVQELAGRQLAKRDLYEFAPTLIELVTSPVDSTLYPVFEEDGSFRGFRHAFSREGVEQDQTVIVETSINGVRSNAQTGRTEIAVRGIQALGSLDTSIAALEAIQRTQQTTADREKRVAEENRQTRKLNERVSALVSHLAGRPISSDPKELWNWWYDFNESERPPVRTAKFVRLYDESNYSIESTATRSFSCECFVRGTLVTTHRGLKAIDEIQTGDLVLTKQIRTGELAWKPVLNATRRPSSPLLSIKAGSDVFTCTPGHVFWISGKGWRKASQLLPGDIFHGATLPIVIEQISDASEAETFNLIVADNANYFVGTQMILSHDFTSRTHTRETIPGFVP